MKQTISQIQKFAPKPERNSRETGWRPTASHKNVLESKAPLLTQSHEPQMEKRMSRDAQQASASRLTGNLTESQKRKLGINLKGMSGGRGAGKANRMTRSTGEFQTWDGKQVFSLTEAAETENQFLELFGEGSSIGGPSASPGTSPKRKFSQQSHDPFGRNPSY